MDSFEALEAWRDAVVPAQHARDCEGGCPAGGSLASELADLAPGRALGSNSWRATGNGRTRSATATPRCESGANWGPDTDPEHLALAPLPALQGGLVMTQTGRDALALETVLGRDDQPHPLLRNP